MPFIDMNVYTRAEIHAEVGGGLQDYLPHKGRKVVCACLRLDLNPSAPKRILVGNTIDIVRWAMVFAGQENFVPLFIKKSKNIPEWSYCGMYRVIRSNGVIREPSNIEPDARQARRGDVTMILRLERQN